MKNVLTKQTEFYNSYRFIELVTLITLLSWFFEKEFVGLVIFMMLIIFIFLYEKNTAPVASIVLFIPFIFSQHFTITTFSNWLLPLLGFVIIGLIIYIIREKPKLKHGKFSLGLIALAISFLTMGLGRQTTTEFAMWAISLLLNVLFIGIYYFFNQTIESKSIEQILYTFFLIGVLASLQVLVFYTRQSNLLESFELKTLTVGWGISNAIATVLLLTIPITGYFIIKNKFNFLYIIGFMVQVVTMLFTFSRGGILILGVSFFPYLYYIFRKSRNKKNTIFGFIFLFIILINIVFIFFYDLVDIFKPLIDKGFDSSGRWDLYIEAFNNFKHHPLFGTGLFYQIEVKNKIYWYHNTFMQMLSSKGIMGFSAMLIHFYQKYRINYRKANYIILPIVVSFVLTDLHGMVDVTYYTVYYMIPLLFLLIALEKLSQPNQSNVIQTKSNKIEGESINENVQIAGKL